MAILKEKEIQERAKGWTLNDNAISREFSLKDFQSAVAFIIKTAFEAEKMDHHPDIFLHSYNKVKLTLSTHSEGGITEKDLMLAEKIESIKL